MGSSLSDHVWRDDRAGGKLAAVLLNPPSDGSGKRTLDRVALAATLIDSDGFATANLFSVPTSNSGGIAVAGSTSDGWDSARPLLLDLLEGSDSLLLAYGVNEPLAPASLHYRDQVDWLWQQIDRLGLTPWSVSSRPLHPSRWHRHTFRDYPGAQFRSALPASFQETARPVRPVRRHGPSGL